MEINERVKRQLDNLCYDNAFLKLKEICTKKAKEKNISLQENDRLNYELDLIEKWGSAKHYLFGLELINGINEFAFILTENNSFVNYILGITSVNSCLYNLPFERYFNEYEALLPKYVIYTPKTKKTQLLKSLYQKFGNRLVRSKDNEATYYVSTEIQDAEIVIKQGYEERICNLTCKELNALNCYAFSIIEVKSIKNCPNKEFSEEKIYNKKQKLFSNDNRLVEQFTEIQEVKDILSCTDYKLIYQEQVLEILNKICNFDMAKSDFYRREIIKRKPNVLKELKTILAKKYGKKGENLLAYILKNTLFTVLKSYVISSLQNEIEY